MSSILKQKYFSSLEKIKNFSYINLNPIIDFLNKKRAGGKSVIDIDVDKIEEGRKSVIDVDVNKIQKIDNK